MITGACSGELWREDISWRLLVDGWNKFQWPFEQCDNCKSVMCYVFYNTKKSGLSDSANTKKKKEKCWCKAGSAESLC